MNYYRIGIFVFCFCTGGLRLLSAQEKPQEWTLKNCIDYALTQNIQLKKSKQPGRQQICPSQIVPVSFIRVNSTVYKYTFSRR